MPESLTAAASGDVHVGSGFPWLRGRPPSGRQVEWAQVHMFRVADGSLREHWAVRDDLRVLEAIDAEEGS